MPSILLCGPAWLSAGFQEQNERDYQQRRAFVLQFGERNELRLQPILPHFWIPVLADKLPEEEQIPDWYLSYPHYETLVQAALEARGIKLKRSKISSLLLWLCFRRRLSARKISTWNGGSRNLLSWSKWSAKVKSKTAGGSDWARCGIA